MPDQDDVIDAVIECMKVRKKTNIESMEYPDKVNRSYKEVDRRFNINGNKVVLEHSQTESFPGQISTGPRWKQVFKELDRRLAGKLPTDSRFNFGADADAMNFANKKEQGKAIDLLEAWILNHATGLRMHTGGTARKLERGSFIQETPKGLKFKASLVRMDTSSFHGRLMPAQGVGSDLQDQRKIRLHQLLKDKLPKLTSSKKRYSASVSVLVIESNDIGLGAPYEIADALFAIIKKFSNKLPDEIYLIETENDSWWIWVLLEDKARSIKNDSYPSYIYEKGVCLEKKFQ